MYNEAERKKKRKEPLVDDSYVKTPPSKKKKPVTVWVYTSSWWRAERPSWRKYKTYHNEVGAMNAVKAELSTRNSWYNYFNRIEHPAPVPFYWIGDNPPVT